MLTGKVREILNQNNFWITDILYTTPPHLVKLCTAIDKESVKVEIPFDGTNKNFIEKLLEYTKTFRFYSRYDESIDCKLQDELYSVYKKLEPLLSSVLLEIEMKCITREDLYIEMFKVMEQVGVTNKSDIVYDIEEISFTDDIKEEFEFLWICHRNGTDLLNFNDKEYFKDYFNEKLEQITDYNIKPIYYILIEKKDNRYYIKEIQSLKGVIDHENTTR